MSSMLSHDLIIMVERFQKEILGFPVPSQPTGLTQKQVQALADHLREEVTELEEAHAKGYDILYHQADALLDLIYVALGGLVKMGLAPKPAFEEVHRANMSKHRGAVSTRPNSEGYDAVKPEDWTPPDFTCLLDVGLDEIKLMKQMSPIFFHLTQLRINKGEDYNAEDIQIDDYMPFQEVSYTQMIYVKALRMVALCRKIMKGGQPNYEGLPGSLLDLLNYGTFFGEWMLEKKLINLEVIQTDREKEGGKDNAAAS